MTTYRPRADLLTTMILFLVAVLAPRTACPRYIPAQTLRHQVDEAVSSKARVVASSLVRFTLAAA